MTMIGEVLLEHGHIQLDQVARALKLQVLSGHRLGTTLVQDGALGLEALASCLAHQHGVPVASAEDLSQADPLALGLLEPADCMELGVLPFRLEKDDQDNIRCVHLAMMTPSRRIVGKVSFKIRRPIKRHVTPELRLAYYIESLLGIRRKPTLLRVQAVDDSTPAEPEVDKREYLAATIDLTADEVGAEMSAGAVKRLTERLKTVEPDAFEPTPTPAAAAGQPGLVNAMLPVDLIIEELREAKSGRRIADALVMPMFEQHGFAALFLIQGSYAIGYATDRRSGGPPIEHLVVPLTSASMLQVAMQTKISVKAAVSEDPLQKKIAHYLGLPAGQECCVGPMSLDGKVAYLLCVQSRPGQPLPDTAQREISKVLARATAAMAGLSASRSLEDLNEQQLKREIVRLREELDRTGKARDALVLGSMQGGGAYSSGVEARLESGNRINPAIVMMLAIIFALLIVFVSGQSTQLFNAVTGAKEETEQLKEDLKR